MSTPVDGLIAQPALIGGEPHVIGRWGSQGLGYTTATVRAVAATLSEACDQADAMAAKEDTDA